jgi:chromosome segregation ATPase
MVAWLDEERRKDKALITRLEERTAAQASLIDDQTRRIQSLEADITALRSTLLSMGLFDETISRLRSEFNAGLEQIETRRSSIDQDTKKMRDMDREALMKGIEELRQEMITRIDRAMQPRRTEEERLSRVAVELQAYADNLSKGLEEFERSLNFLEEQRRQDARRISDINAEMAELAKRNEGYQAKLDLLEDLSRRSERLVNELTGSQAELRQQRQQWVEEQALAEQQRERIIQDMVRRMDSFAEDRVIFERQVEGWADTHRNTKLQVEEFQRIADRVDRRLNELAEIQRLSEERFRQEWEDFMGDDQKRWRQFTITNEEAWRESTKALEELKSALAEVKERTERHVDFIQYLMKAQREILNTLAANVTAIRDHADEGRGSLPPLT